MLSNKYLRDEEKNYVEAELPQLYADLIASEEWSTFVAKRKSEKFIVMLICHVY
jgi:hypothetical protein